MASLRPEGALNSAKGLTEIGRHDDALDALHLVLSNRRFRQWNATMEKIAEEYVRLCLSTGKPRYAKDGLIQFRNICQPNNLQSLDGILKLFRSLAEERVRSSRGKLTAGADGLIDLEEVESGESLLMSALAIDPAMEDERVARAALRDLWDALRTILEVCRNNPALDETYHATAIMAFDFCSEFKRKNEFRRICETLRLHQQQGSYRGSSSVNSILANQQTPPVDPLVRTLETRSYQLKVAKELGLWSVAFHTVEEMYHLLAKKRPTAQQLHSYYSALAEVLWMSSNAQQHQMFHAACLLKLSVFGSVTQGLADQATLAVLAASIPDSLVLAAASESAASLAAESGDGSAADFAAEKAARLTLLTGCGTVPTAQSLMSDLVAKGLLSLASEPVKKMFAVLTNDSSTRESGWVNAALPAMQASLASAGLAQYAPALARVALVKVTKDMQSMYSCIRFEKFESLTSSILPIAESVRLLAQLKRTEQIDVSIDYVSKTISFKSAAPSASSGVAGAVKSIRTEAARIRARSAGSKASELAESVLFDEDSFFARLDAERKRCDERRNASDARKESLEQSKIRRAQELADQLRRAEEERLEADAKSRQSEITRKEYEAKKKEDELARSKGYVERMIATGGGALVAGLTDADLLAMGATKLNEMHKQQLAKERQDRINKRRNEARRLEHTARLFRVAENEKVEAWAKTVFETDKAGFAQMAAEKAEEWRQAAEAKKASVDALVPFADVLLSWKNERMDEFNRKQEAKAEERFRQAQAAMRKETSAAEETSASELARVANISRDEFKELAKSLPAWKESQAADEE